MLLHLRDGYIEYTTLCVCSCSLRACCCTCETACDGGDSGLPFSRLEFGDTATSAGRVAWDRTGGELLLAAALGRLAGHAASSCWSGCCCERVPVRGLLAVQPWLAAEESPRRARLTSCCVAHGNARPSPCFRFPSRPSLMAAARAQRAR